MSPITEVKQRPMPAGYADVPVNRTPTGRNLGHLAVGKGVNIHFSDYDEAPKLSVQLMPEQLMIAANKMPAARAAYLEKVLAALVPSDMLSLTVARLLDAVGRLRPEDIFSAVNEGQLLDIRLPFTEADCEISASRVQVRGTGKEMRLVAEKAPISLELRPPSALKKIDPTSTLSRKLLAHAESTFTRLKEALLSVGKEAIDVCGVLVPLKPFIEAKSATEALLALAELKRPTNKTLQQFWDLLLAQQRQGPELQQALRELREAGVENLALTLTGGTRYVLPVSVLQTLRGDIVNGRNLDRVVAEIGARGAYELLNALQKSALVVAPEKRNASQKAEISTIAGRYTVMLEPSGQIDMLPLR